MGGSFAFFFGGGGGEISALPAGEMRWPQLCGVFEADVGLFLGRAWGAIHVAMGDWRLPRGPWAKNIREALRNTLTTLNKHAGRSTTLSKAFTSHSQRNSPIWKSTSWSGWWLCRLCSRAELCCPSAKRCCGDPARSVNKLQTASQELQTASQEP